QICSIELFLWLRKALKENPKLLRRFSFFPKLNIGAISLLLSDNDNKMSYNLINEVAHKRKENEKPFTLFKIKDIYKMQKKLVDNDINRRILKLNKLSEIHILHDEMVYLINDLKIIVNYKYPKCKIANIKKDHIWIEIIPNSKSLHREGYEMNHCIFSYDDDIRENSYYAARMLKPERLTILFKENIYGYQIIDIHGKHNSDSPKNSENLIKKWLNGKVHFPDERLQLTLFENEDYLSSKQVGFVTM
ncbi:MAG: PcfJ domain-containing protein, partial [Candidatus Cloacimonadota bacterium]|nr:PcfJ domain-containing protein [Candidatus Cloacimonadota bacterium]